MPATLWPDPSIHFIPDHSYLHLHTCFYYVILCLSVTQFFFFSFLVSGRHKNKSEYCNFSKHVHTYFSYHSLFILPSMVSIGTPILNKYMSSYPLLCVQMIRQLSLLSDLFFCYCISGTQRRVLSLFSRISPANIGDRYGHWTLN